MKRILLLLAITFTALQSNAQISTAITGLKALNRLWYSCSYDNCLTLAQEEFMHDSTLTIDSLIYALVSTSTGLQGTLNAGSAASDASGGTNNFTLTGAVGANVLAADPTYLQLNVSGNIRAQLTNAGLLYLGSPSASNYNTLGSMATVNRQNFLPDEGGTGLAGTVMLHTTKDSLIVGSLVGANSTVNKTNISIKNGGVTSLKLYDNTGNGVLQLRDGTSNFNLRLYGLPFSGSLTADRNLYAPDESGSIVTHITKSPVTVDNGGGVTSVLSSGSLIVDDAAGNSATLDNTRLFVAATGGFASSYDKNSINFSENNVGTSTIISQNITLATGITGTSNAYTTSLPLMSGEIALNGATTTPTITATGVAVGAGSIVFTAGSNDAAGQIEVTAGAGATTGAILTMTYGTPYTGKTPIVIFEAANNNAAGITVFSSSATSSTQALQTSSTSAPLVSGNQYNWKYQVRY